MNDYPNFGLPKWPQMRVIGETISTARALEIIRRTDTFFTQGSTGNDRAWNRRVREIVGMPPDTLEMTDVERRQLNYNAHYAAEEAWRDKWGTVQTAYVHNSWISCAFIGGPHGWCHPNGTVYFSNNVGKWPNSDDLIQDWKRIVAEFGPFRIDVLFMDDEECEESKPAFGLQIRESTIKVIAGHEPHPWFADFGGWRPGPSIVQMVAQFHLPVSLRERAISEDTVQAWADAQKRTNDGASTPPG